MKTGKSTNCRRGINTWNIIMKEDDNSALDKHNKLSIDVHTYLYAYTYIYMISYKRKRNAIP